MAEVLMPPSLTTIVLPRLGLAVSTATTRDQPPESLAFTRTRPEPKVSASLLRRLLVRWAFPRTVNVVAPGNASRRLPVGGSFLKKAGLPLQGSGEMRT